MTDKSPKDAKALVKLHGNDTGSTAVQIVALTQEITHLTGHLTTHKKDFSCRRTLLQKVATRKRFLRYLQKTNVKMYTKVTDILELKK